MRLFVTGATGFIGSAVVEAAIGRGHQVRAIVRPTADLSGVSWAADPSVELVEGDVRRPDSYAGALEGVDAVLHLAAVFGDFFDQFAVTVVGSERLLDAMATAKVARMVLVSTFSNYDYLALDRGAVLDEDSPLESQAAKRDGYTQTKLYQEQVVRKLCDTESIALTTLRPGAVYGAGKLWDGGLAKTVGNVGVAVAPGAHLKLIYVKNCAEAIVLAAERDEAIGETLNLVDDDLPTQAEYLRALRRHGFATPDHVVPIPYGVLRTAAQAIDVVNQRFFAGRAKLPELAVPARLAAAYRPHRYTNERAKRVLGWTPRYSLDAALDDVASTEVAR